MISCSGGKDAAIVCKDVDIEAAAAKVHPFYFLEIRHTNKTSS
jgi:acyl-CoA reductase-like NAD-dependent aldehyde dehydrogenase